MPNKTSSVTQAGQLIGAKISIVKICNDGLNESITIINQGTVIQPLSGWVLASLRGQVFFQFPDALLIRPGKCVVVYSGQQEPGEKHPDQIDWVFLTWTSDQVWNNHGDTAILFDANDREIDRFSYPHNRFKGSSANQPLVLKRDSAIFKIYSDTLLREKQVTRKQDVSFTGQS